MPASLRITLLLSLSLHMACFGIFEPTFGSVLKKKNLARVSFLGPILQMADFSLNVDYGRSLNKNIVSRQLPFSKTRLIKKKENNSLALGFQPTKPLAKVLLNKEKRVFLSPANNLTIFNRRKKEPTVIFHPPLPYSFLLYFKDRQIAHIEFMFYISSSGKIVSIKRKISSGNLDADLLALRYIVHCLNLIEGKFPPQTWQTVKIELSRKDDK